MWTSLLVIALAAVQPAQLEGVNTIQDLGRYIEEAADLDRTRDLEAAELDRTRDLALLLEFEDFGAQVETLKNATSQLLKELDIVRSRQAASAAVQASQVIMMVAYFLTILGVYIVKRCQKVSEKSKRKEFERLEMQLRSSKAKRRAAAAKEKSAPAQSLE